MVTCEISSKWYSLLLIHPDSRVETIQFPDEPCCGSPWVDHAPNPRHVVAYAERMGYDIDEVALDCIAGRFWQEGLNENFYE
jgi:hypothetical protein